MSNDCVSPYLFQTLTATISRCSPSTGLLYYQCSYIIHMITELMVLCILELRIGKIEHKEALTTDWKLDWFSGLPRLSIWFSSSSLAPVSHCCSINTSDSRDTTSYSSSSCAYLYVSPPMQPCVISN